jgi:Tetratricopeptide repeat
MNNFAITWEGQGRYAEAAKIMEECVGLRSCILGIDHLYTLSSCMTLIGWQAKKLEINISGAKDLASDDIISQIE